MEYIKNPRAIEEGSMTIIESEMSRPEDFTFDELQVIKRVIHTTADFEYESLIRFSGDPTQVGMQHIKKGCKIYSDTNMIAVGVNRVLLQEYGCEMVNYVHDEDVKARAIEKGITRSMVAMEKAFYDKEIGIYLIGNAPTALIKLLELIDGEDHFDGLIVGVPVGFVGAKESKEALMDMDIPYITIKGRKGGSPVAVAIMNAIMKIGKER